MKNLILLGFFLGVFHSALASSQPNSASCSALLEHMTNLINKANWTDSDDIAEIVNKTTLLLNRNGTVLKKKFFSRDTYVINVALTGIDWGTNHNVEVKLIEVIELPKIGFSDQVNHIYYFKLKNADDVNVLTQIGFFENKMASTDEVVSKIQDQYQQGKDLVVFSAALDNEQIEKELRRQKNNIRRGVFVTGGNRMGGGEDSSSGSGVVLMPILDGKGIGFGLRIGDGPFVLRL